MLRLLQRGEREINFETIDDDLKSYLLGGGGEITIEVDDARRPEVDTTIEIRVIFDVDINVIKDLLHNDPKRFSNAEVKKSRINKFFNFFTSLSNL